MARYTKEEIAEAYDRASDDTERAAIARKCYEINSGVLATQVVTLIAPTLQAKWCADARAAFNDTFNFHNID